MILPYTAHTIPGSRVIEIKGEKAVHLPDSPTAIDLAKIYGYKVGIVDSRLKPRNFDFPLPLLYLLPHQQDAIRRLWFGGILADSYNLGKSVTAIGWAETLSRFYNANITLSVLILCPDQNVSKWESNIKKFGTSSVSYTVRPYSAHAYVKSVDLLILDQAARLTNNNTLRYKRVDKIKRHLTLAIARDPVSFTAKDLFSLLHLARPDWFPTYEQFDEMYFNTLGQDHCFESAHLRNDLSKVLVWRSTSADFSYIHLTAKDEEGAYDLVRYFTGKSVIVAASYARIATAVSRFNAVSIHSAMSAKKAAQMLAEFRLELNGFLVSDFSSLLSGVDLTCASNCIIFGSDVPYTSIMNAVDSVSHLDRRKAKTKIYLVTWDQTAEHKKKKQATLAQPAFSQFCEHINL